jgi:hypothetical protein
MLEAKGRAPIRETASAVAARPEAKAEPQDIEREALWDTELGNDDIERG